MNKNITQDTQNDNQMSILYEGFYKISCFFCTVTLIRKKVFRLRGNVSVFVFDDFPNRSMYMNYFLEGIPRSLQRILFIVL